MHARYKPLRLREIDPFACELCGHTVEHYNNKALVDIAYAALAEGEKPLPAMIAQLHAHFEEKGFVPQHLHPVEKYHCTGTPGLLTAIKEGMCPFDQKGEIVNRGQWNVIPEKEWEKLKEAYDLTRQIEEFVIFY